MGKHLPRRVTRICRRLAYVGILLLVVHSLSFNTINTTAKTVFKNSGSLESSLDFQTQQDTSQHYLTSDNGTTTLLRKSIQTELMGLSVNDVRSANAPDSRNRWRPSLQWAHSCALNASKYPGGPFSVPWKYYTLGDCVKMCYKCAKSARASLLGYKSLAGRYFKNACHGIDQVNHTLGNNYTYLERLLRKYKDDPTFAKPAEDDFVIHLRLGDVIEHSNASVSRMLYEGAVPYHGAKAFTSFKSIKSVSEFLNDIDESGMSKVTIRGGSHFPHKFLKSRAYASCLEQAISKAGYPVTMAIENDTTPDQDFYFMVHAKHIALSTGGYSRLIGQMVKRLGGKVIGTDLQHTDSLQLTTTSNVTTS